MQDGEESSHAWEDRGELWTVLDVLEPAQTGTWIQIRVVGRTKSPSLGLLEYQKQEHVNLQSVRPLG